MKKLLIIIIGLFSIGLINSQTNTFSGHWSLTKIETNGTIKNENTKFIFNENGSIEVNGFEFGKWNFDSTKMEVELQSMFSEEEFNGFHKVLQLSEKVLVFSKDKTTYFFKRIDFEKIKEQNKNSNLVGIWKLNHNDFDDLFLKFELPNVFTFISASSNTTSSQKGEWEYLKESNEVNIEGVQFILNGKSRIKDVSSDFLALVRPQETLTFNKVNNSAIEWLNFTYEEIEASQSEESELPEAWRYDHNFVSHLSKFKNLVYDNGVYIPEAEALIHSKILKKIEANIQEESISLSNIIMTKHDTLQYSENYKGHLMNQNNYFFPKDEPDYYRVVGIETIDGYECTVIEGFSDDAKIKYWMINNQPGVYAKIIVQQDRDVFDKMNYNILTLLKSN